MVRVTPLFFPSPFTLKQSTAFDFNFFLLTKFVKIVEISVSM